jgi:hypothetical protein
MTKHKSLPFVKNVLTRDLMAFFVTKEKNKPWSTVTLCPIKCLS